MGEPDQFFRSYLLAFVFWNGLAVGSLAILMLQYLTGGAWGIAIRRRARGGRAHDAVCGARFVPVIFGMHRLYEWTHADVVAQDELLQKKTFYLNAPFFAGAPASRMPRGCCGVFPEPAGPREQDTASDHEGSTASCRSSRAEASSSTR